MKQERDKFQLDLREANARNAILAKEFDDRHVQMEKSTEAQLLYVLILLSNKTVPREYYGVWFEVI